MTTMNPDITTAKTIIHTRLVDWKITFWTGADLAYKVVKGSDLIDAIKFAADWHGIYVTSIIKVERVPLSM